MVQNNKMFSKLKVEDNTSDNRFEKPAILERGAPQIYNIFSNPNAKKSRQIVLSCAIISWCIKSRLIRGEIYV